MSRRRSVAWIIDSLHLAGAERLAVDFAAAPPPGWQVELIALMPGAAEDAAWGEALRRLNGHLHILRMRRLADPVEFGRFVHLLKRLRPDLLHTHLDYATVWGSAAGRLLGIPHVATLHVMPPEAGRRRWRAALRDRIIAGGLHRARRLIFVSEAQRQAWRHRLDAGERARVVGNGTASAPTWTAEDRRRWRNEVGLAPEAWVVTTVAMVRTAKGWRDWLGAAEMVAAQRPEARFVWVGGGDELSALREAAAASPAASQLVLPGARADVRDWLRGADVFVLPSHGEALPTAILEAAAQGLPIIATDLPAVQEILGEAGSYCVPGNSRALAERILAWGPTSTDAAQSARIARQRWADNYSPAVWRQRLATVYDECLSAPEPVGARPHGAEAGEQRRPTRILMVEFFSRGGLFHYAWQLTQALARRPDTSVHLLTARHPEVASAPAGVELSPHLWIWDPTWRPALVPRRLLRAWRGGRYVVGWVQALRAVAGERPDVVLLTDFEHRCDRWFVRRLRRLSRRRGFLLVDIWHNVEAFQRYRPNALVRHLRWRDRMAQEFDVVFVHGRNLAEAMRQQTGVEAHVVPHGNQQWLQQLAGPDPKLSLRLALPARKPMVLLFGALSPYKGVEILIQALSQIPPKRRPVVVIAGMPTAGARSRYWRELAQRLQLEAWLRWDQRYIPTEEIAWYFRRADLVVLPYMTASQSGVAHLALTFGKPLIVSDCGGLPELIDGNGVVVPPGDVTELAAALEHMSNDVRMRHRYGRRSSELAETRHDWDEIARTMLSVLRREMNEQSETTADVELAG